MKTEAKKKFALNAVPEAALEEAGLAKETILAAIPMDGVVLLTKDSTQRQRCRSTPMIGRLPTAATGIFMICTVCIRMPTVLHPLLPIPVL